MRNPLFPSVVSFVTFIFLSRILDNKGKEKKTIRKYSRIHEEALLRGSSGLSLLLSLSRFKPLVVQIQAFWKSSAP
jgi:hypothetical protein